MQVPVRLLASRSGTGEAGSRPSPAAYPRRVTTTRPPTDLHTITTLDRLLAVYPTEPGRASLAKETPILTETYARFIEASPFCVVSTVGDGGLDQSPRGDAPGFVQLRDRRTLAIPDRRGNNRLDTLRNLVADPRIGLLFLVPGVGHELRVRGTAVLTTDPAELARHEVRGITPASVIVVDVERTYFQCARAIKRSRLWDKDARVDPATVPTAGQMTLEAGGFAHEQEARAYDDALDARQEATLY